MEHAIQWPLRLYLHTSTQGLGSFLAMTLTLNAAHLALNRVMHQADKFTQIHVFQEEVVGDPGIEPGMGLPGGVTVRCRTLQHVARQSS